MNSKLAVQVAKDILKNINKVSFQRGSYINAKFNWEKSENQSLLINELSDNDILNKKHIKDMEENCHVCALGRIVISLATKIKLKKKQVWGERKQLVKGLKKIFKKKDIDTIENVFEENYSPGSKIERFLRNVWDRPLEDSLTESALNVRMMKAICENIIENEGRFKP